MKKFLKFIGILISANIKKILILIGILMISSFSYYGAVDENGERVISFEQNATQSSSAFQSEVVDEEQQEIKQVDAQQEAETRKTEEQKKEKEQIKTKQEDTEDESVTVQKLSKVTQVEEKTQTKEVVKEQQKETKKQEEKKQEEIKATEEDKQEKIKYSEVKVAEKTECIDNNHKIGIGNSNKWFDSQQQAIAEYNAELEKWSQKAKSGAIDYEELYQKCPYGYETWNCPNCKKWTLNYYYH